MSFARAASIAVLLIPTLVFAEEKPSIDHCTPPPTGKEIPFSAGEKIEMKLDVLGVSVGTLNMSVLPGRRPDAYVIEARGHTESIAADFYAITATAQSHVGHALEDRAYDEDDAEDGERRSVAVSFPSKDGTLAVHATVDGNAKDVSLQAPADTRDVLAMLFASRTMTFLVGPQFCMPIFGARRIWMLSGTVAGHEVVQTEAGDFSCTHLAGTATRVDGSGTPREVHLWISDDATHIPVAALGLVQGKTLRAQIVKYVPGFKQRKK